MNSFISPQLEQETLQQELEDVKNFEYGYQPNSLKLLDNNRVSFILLEGIELSLELSLKGFQIIDTLPKQSYEGNIYESMDSLLSEVSPQYRAKFLDSLMDELNKLKD